MAVWASRPRATIEPPTNPSARPPHHPEKSGLSIGTSERAALPSPSQRDGATVYTTGLAGWLWQASSVEATCPISYRYGTHSFF